MNKDAYFADDREARLRMQSPLCCRMCRHLTVHSPLFEKTLRIRCHRLVDESEPSLVTNNLLFRLAKFQTYVMKPLHSNSYDDIDLLHHDF
jgi:hypothetical protein